MAQKRKRFSQIFYKKENDHKRLSMSSDDDLKHYQESFLETGSKRIKEIESERASAWERRKRYSHQIKKLNSDKVSSFSKKQSKGSIQINSSSSKKPKDSRNSSSKASYEDFQEKTNENLNSSNNKENISDSTKTKRSLTFTVRKPLCPVIQILDDSGKSDYNSADKLSEQNSSDEQTSNNNDKCKTSSKLSRNRSYVISKNRVLKNISSNDFKRFEEWMKSKNLKVIKFKNINNFANLLRAENQCVVKDHANQKCLSESIEQFQITENVNVQETLIELKSLLEKDLPTDLAVYFLDGLEIYLPSCINNSLYWECRGIFAIKEGNENNAIEFYDKAINIEEKSEESIYEV